MKRCLFTFLFLQAMLALPAGAKIDSVGQPPDFGHSMGVVQKEIVPLSPVMLLEISDQLLRDDIAVVDIDAEAFDLDDDKPKQKKRKDPLDDIEFVSERDQIPKK